MGRAGPTPIHGGGRVQASGGCGQQHSGGNQPQGRPGAAAWPGLRHQAGEEQIPTGVCVGGGEQQLLSLAREQRQAMGQQPPHRTLCYAKGGLRTRRCVCVCGCVSWCAVRGVVCVV